VKELQQKLQAKGFGPGPIDGVFGPRTEAALVAFQRATGLAPDGVAGPLTWSALAR
jgi:peptidoglycan hydrolase-like protein with peptidoglycan-binding domain